MTDDAIIRVEGLRGGYGEELVLKDIGFEVGRSDVFAILGGSGCGKSTLIRHLIGLEKAWSGRIVVNGIEVTSATEEEMQALRRRIGMLFQGGALFSSMTVAENVGLPLREHTRLDAASIRAIASMKLGMVNLAGSEEKFPAELSGGMRKRAALARAMALDPEILFFDEPSAGLDPITSAELDELILQINDALGATIVMVTHELSSVARVARHGLLLDRGVAVAQGTVEEIQRDGGEYAQRFFGRKAAEAPSQRGGSLAAIIEAD